MNFTYFENWLFQIKKELANNKNVDSDLGNVTIEVNKIRYNKNSRIEERRIFIVKINNKNYKTLVW